MKNLNQTEANLIKRARGGAGVAPYFGQRELNAAETLSQRGLAIVKPTVIAEHPKQIFGCVHIDPALISLK